MTLAEMIEHLKQYREEHGNVSAAEALGYNEGARISVDYLSGRVIITVYEGEPH